MTSYASQEAERNGLILRWELRSVNHRFLDISLKLPDTLRCIEMDARGLISNRFRRGRVECSLGCKPVSNSDSRLQVNGAVVRALMQAADDLGEYAQRPLAPVDPLDVLRWPGVLDDATVHQQDAGTDSLALLNEILDKALVVRTREGESLTALMTGRLAAIQDHVEAVRAREPLIRATHRQRLVAKLAEITSSPNQERLEQELVYWAQRLDVTEELDRIGAHVNEFRNILGANDAVGRRLDFLLQELNREANTLGSKVTDSVSTGAAVEIKVLLEQLREQVQNVE
jgi:uncharacterized protein (TIGR00255 family)